MDHQRWINTADLKKALSLGVRFRYEIVGTIDRDWSIWLGLADDLNDLGQWVCLANNRGMKTYSTVDSALSDLRKQGLDFENRETHKLINIIF